MVVLCSKYSFIKHFNTKINFIFFSVKILFVSSYNLDCDISTFGISFSGEINHFGPIENRQLQTNKKSHCHNS